MKKKEYHVKSCKDILLENINQINPLYEENYEDYEIESDEGDDEVLDFFLGKGSEEVEKAAEKDIEGKPEVEGENEEEGIYKPPKGDDTELFPFGGSTPEEEIPSEEEEEEEGGSDDGENEEDEEEKE